MEISQRGIDLIKRFESFEPVAYRCPAGAPTIGYGHTKTVTALDVGVKRIDQAQGEELLRGDLAEAEACVAKVSQGLPQSLTQGQYDALTSFVFNCGCGALKGSTLLKKLRVGDIQGAASEFKRWNKAKGEVLNGLTVRRAAEAQLFLTPYF